MTIDLRFTTETDVIDAMILLENLATPAGELMSGDHIVYRRNGVLHSTEVESVYPTGRDGWVGIRTIGGDVWECSPRNRGQYRLPH